MVDFYLSRFSFPHINQEAVIHQIREHELMFIRHLETRIKKYKLAVLFLTDGIEKRELTSSIRIYGSEN